jgi:uncharacterized protein involved in exopolysaccharide biosynthesis
MNPETIPDPTSNGGVPHQADDISLVEVMNVLLRHRRLIVFLPLALAVGLGGWAVAQERTYRATAAFMPQTPGQSGSSAAALARQFGINVGGPERAGQSPQFYADLVRGREVLRQAVESNYRLPGDRNPGARTLIDFYQIEEESGHLPAWRRAVERLGQDVAVSVARETGVVELRVSAGHPELAELITARLLELLNEFNLQTRQSQAQEEGRFVGARMTEAHSELLEAEEALKTFLQQNRHFANSPELGFEHDRLQRQVAMRQEIYTSLVQSHEQSRIDAVRDTPVITVIASPIGSAEPESRGTVIRLLVGLMLGFAIAVVLSFLLDFSSRTRDDERDEYREFNRLKREAWNDLRNPGRLVRSGAGRAEGAATNP